MLAARQVWVIETGRKFVTQKFVTFLVVLKSNLSQLTARNVAGIQVYLAHGDSLSVNVARSWVCRTTQSRAVRRFMTPVEVFEEIRADFSVNLYPAGAFL